MSIQELIDEANKHGCSVGILAVKGEETTFLQLRLSKGGYNVTRILSPYDITQAKIDIIAFEFNVMMDKLEAELAEHQ